jgi:hypothetical protein
VRLLPITPAVAGVLVVAAIAVATACDDDSSTGSPNGGSTQTVAATPICTFIPGEGIICRGTPQPRDCRPTADHIPFINQLILPKALPEGVSFAEACLTADPAGLPSSQNAEIKFASDDGGAHFQVSTVIIAVAPQNRETIQLGSIPGYIIRNPLPDGRTVYGVEFSLGGRAYTVIAFLGPGNRLMEADLNAVALDMATQD